MVETFLTNFLKTLILEFMKTEKIAISQENDYTVWLDYPYFKENCKFIATDLSKRQDADPKTIKQTNFTENLDLSGNAIIFFILEEGK